MRTRAAAGLFVVAVAAGFTGHVLGGHATPPKPPPPAATIHSAPLPPELAAPPAHGTHILWLFIGGRWRAVPS
jgi:hypothetical protein